MRERAVKEQADARKQFEDYVRDTAGGSPVNELHKLSDLKQRRDISEQEFEREKARLLSTG